MRRPMPEKRDVLERITHLAIDAVLSEVGGNTPGVPGCPTADHSGVLGPNRAVLSLGGSVPETVICSGGAPLNFLDCAKLPPPDFLIL